MSITDVTVSRRQLLILILYEMRNMQNLIKNRLFDSIWQSYYIRILFWKMKYHTKSLLVQTKQLENFDRFICLEDQSFSQCSWPEFLCVYPLSNIIILTSSSMCTCEWSNFFFIFFFFGGKIKLICINYYDR